jgi:hypothetical protein
MPAPRLRHVLTASLCAAALWAGACHRETQPQAVQNTADRQTSTPPLKNAPGELPQSNELQPQPQSVTVPPPAGSAADLSAREQDLTARERELSQRQAELDARERQIQDGERTPGKGPATPVPSEPMAPAAPPIAEPRLEPRVVSATVPAGTRLSIALAGGLSSKSSRVGQRVRARVVSSVREDGVVVIPSGSALLGEVTEAGFPRRLGGRAILGVRFTDLALPSGATVPIQASYVQQGPNRSRRSAAIVGGTAAGGAIVGHNVNRGNRSRGTLVGALIGAAVGSAVAANTQGPAVVVPSGSVIHVRLRRSVAVRVAR